MENRSASDITPEVWQKVKPLFEAASNMEPAQRAVFLAQNCDDEIVRIEVQKLLANHDQAGSFLSTPALGVLADCDSAASSDRFSEGQLLAGRFRIMRFIASGGMGSVYEAEDQELHERVALKTIRPELLAQPNTIARFRREVHLARQVTHPNVCRVFDLFRHRSTNGETETELVFISMELLHGIDLATWLKKRGRMNENEALPLITQMASALAAAHAVGIVHRDFKPQNVVLVSGSGAEQVRVVVTDFGLALQPDKSGDASFVTGSGLLGTPAYMSPEQIEGRPATPASDIYSLGLVAYEMVTGSRPFQGDTPMSAAMKRLFEAPIPPRRFETGLSSLWESVILRCLERNPTERFVRVDEVARALASEDSTLATTAYKVADLDLQPHKKRLALAFAVVGAAAVLALSVGAHYYLHRTPKLTDKDTLVLADFSNDTGDPVFEDALKTALTVSLRQSPFLNVLSDNKVAQTLKLMARPSDTKLSAEVMREICERTGSKAYIAGSIATLGSEYVLALKAVNFQSGDTLAQEQVTATAKEKILDALGEAATKLRGELGESLTTIQKFDVPLVQATTSSLDALRAYSLGEKTFRSQGSDAALIYHKRAIEIDPTFAMAYLEVGNDYAGSAQIGRANEYYRKAFEAREHASDWEKLVISGQYYENVTGELEKAASVFQEETESYPRNSGAYVDLGNIYGMRGEYEKAFQLERNAMQLDPDTISPYENLSNFLLAIQRLDDALHVAQEATDKHLDYYPIHVALYAISFLKADSASMTEQQQWLAGQPEVRNWGLTLASDTEAYAGHLRKARELTKQSIVSAIRADSKENGAIWQENAALREGAFGNAAEAKHAATEALKVAPQSQGVEDEAGLAFAIAGDAAKAESLVQDLSKRYPLDTQIQSLWLPATQAQLALDRNNPVDALNDLQTAAPPLEFGQIIFLANLSCLYPTYIRGDAYLAAGQGAQAAAEFQKILNHSGIVWNCWTGALAHVGVARANALQAKTSRGADAKAARTRALAAYKDFLTLWKDADPDIPIFKQAKSEYAKLQ
jgi:eukaryotic-like serine/threonine-protein kinase